MKWQKAIQLLEWAIEDGTAVTIRYHRKWNTQLPYYDKVDSISAYTYEGTECKAVNTYHDQLLESTHIIDEVIVNQ